MIVLFYDATWSFQFEVFYGIELNCDLLFGVMLYLMYYVEFLKQNKKWTQYDNPMWIKWYVNIVINQIIKTLINH
jgi:hypothetical protein